MVAGHDRSGQAGNDCPGLWFGLVELTGPEDFGWHTNVAGCRNFDPEEDSVEWAGEPDCWPDGRYLFLTGLNKPAGQGADAMLSHATDLIRSMIVAGTIGRCSGRVR
ncbi:hypothetical protein [Actinomadura sp. 3N508]|uniref:hypothetical protein n=1 Tax=Actinomadura sp. 3N508 TaxID=3375153 RepID=UPI0037A6AD6B